MRRSMAERRPLLFLRHMRSHVHRAQLIDENAGVIALVGVKSHAGRAIGERLDHIERGGSFGLAVGWGQAGVDDEAGAILHQGVAKKSELGFHARALAVELGLGIGGRGVRCDSFERFSPLKSTSVLRPEPGGGSLPEPSLGVSSSSAQASISVPSTEKCSFDRGLSRGAEPEQSRPYKSGQQDKWSFCLRAVKMAAAQERR